LDYLVIQAIVSVGCQDSDLVPCRVREALALGVASRNLDEVVLVLLDAGSVLEGVELQKVDAFFAGEAIEDVDLSAYRKGVRRPAFEQPNP
jgi:hypothetical protein